MEETIITSEAAPAVEVPPQPPKKKLLKIVVLVVAVLLVVAGAVYGVYAFSKKSILPQIGSPTLVPTQIVQPTSTVVSPTNTTDATANWKTYTNKSLGFEIKYPSDYSIGKEYNDENNRSTQFIGTNSKFEVGLRSADGIDLKSYYYMDSPIKGTTLLNGELANIYESPSGYCDGPGCSEPYVSYVAKKNKDLYIITFFGDAIVSVTENQILSTFKFTSTQNTVDATADWKTFSNTDFKYQIKYPPQWNLIYTGNGLEMSNLSSIREFKEVYPLHELAITGGLSFDTMKESTTNWVWANTPKSENTTINGNKAWSIEGLMKWTDNKTYWRKYILVQFESNNTTIELSWFDTADQNSKKIFDQMLSTFKFTN